MDQSMLTFAHQKATATCRGRGEATACAAKKDAYPERGAARSLPGPVSADCPAASDGVRPPTDRLRGDLACLSVKLAMPAEDAIAEPGGVG
jgi:hypothetical protein